MGTSSKLVEALGILADIGRACRKKPTGASTVKEVTPAGTDVPGEPEHRNKDTNNVR